MIYDDLCYKHEADIFANQQKYVKTLNPHEVFVANVEAGNDDQLTIKRLVETYGMKISNKKGPCTICAVSSLELIYGKYGYHVLNRVLRLIIGAWEGDMNSFSANILKAVAKLVVTYRDHLDEDVFKEKVGSLSVRQLTRNAKERRPGSMGFAEAMVIAYNGKKKNMHMRLAMNKLYAKDFTELSDENLEDDNFYETYDPDEDMDLTEDEE
jgi:hypothetical protein